jgi:hypothetical protein
VGAGKLRLAFAESADFSKRKAEEIANREVLSKAVQSVTGRTLGLAFELRSDLAGQRALSGEELIERVMAEFDAEELPLEDDDKEGT